MNKILIDTNIYSLAMRGDQDVLSTLRQMRHIGISAVSIGELLSGFRGGNREEENWRELGIFLDSPRVHLYPVDENSAEYYSSVLHQLKEQGTPIPTNDIWISAIARQYDFAIYSYDSHFKNIKNVNYTFYSSC